MIPASGRVTPCGRTRTCRLRGRRSTWRPCCRRTRWVRSGGSPTRPRAPWRRRGSPCRCTRLGIEERGRARGRVGYRWGACELEGGMNCSGAPRWRGARVSRPAPPLTGAGARLGRAGAAAGVALARHRGGPVVKVGHAAALASRHPGEGIAGTAVDVARARHVGPPVGPCVRIKRSQHMLQGIGSLENSPRGALGWDARQHALSTRCQARLGAHGARTDFGTTAERSVQGHTCCEQLTSPGVVDLRRRVVVEAEREQLRQLQYGCMAGCRPI